MVININKVGFKKRLWERSLNGLWLFVLIFISGFFITGLYLFVLASLLIIFLNFYLSYKESRIYIENIEFNINGLGIDYFIKDSSIKRLDLKFEDLEIEWFGNGIGISSVFTPKLVFSKNAQVVLVQYSIGEWDEDKMRDFERLINAFKKGSLLAN